MSIFLAPPTGIKNHGFAMKSLRFDGAANYLSKTFGSAPTTRTKCTISLWLKRASLSGSQERIFNGYDGSAPSSSILSLTTGHALDLQFGGASAYNVTTSAIFRDVAAWCHVCVVIDTTQTQSAHSASDSRVRIYVNGVQQTTSGSMPTQNATHQFTHNGAQSTIGSNYLSVSNLLYGYLADFVFIDGQALTPSDFAYTNPITGQWTPKSNPVSGLTMGANGFWLSFDNTTSTTTVCYDDAGGIRGAGAGSNDWTPNGISVTAGVNNDSLFDVPINYDDGIYGRGNFCTLNSIDLGSASVQDGGLARSSLSAGGNTCRTGTIAITSGKIYFEATATYAAVADFAIGLLPSISSPASSWPGGIAGYNLYGYASSANYSTYVDTAGTDTGIARDASPVTLGVAYDADNGKIWFRHAGSWISGDPAAGTSPSYSGIDASRKFRPAIFGSGGSGATSWTVNFGQRPFAYTPPTGFKALCTQNLPEPSIIRPEKNFDVKTWSGNSNTQNITEMKFQPDLVWTKARSTTTGHRLVDAVRGATLSLDSSNTAVEATEATGLTTFNSDGFTLGADADYNNSGQTFVGWCFDEGVIPGLDIVTFTTGSSGTQTIPHNLGVTPALFILKARNSATSWYIWHKSLASATNSYLNLNNTNGVGTSVGLWPSAANSSNCYALIGTSVAASSNHVGYIFAEVPGFSRFSSYTGNGNADGPFVWCGFRPKFLLIKRTDTTGNWEMHDTSRSTYNVVNEAMWANLTNAEAGSGGLLDILSNGFKLRSTTTDINASGGTYIFAAFAEATFKYARAR